MSMPEVLLALSGGNPGAVTVCMRLLKETPAIDPQDILGGLGNLLALDSYNIWEHRIWMLYKDVCGQDLVKMIAVLRAHQLGQLAGVTECALNHAIDNRGEGLDLDAVLKAVQDRLPRFIRTPAPKEGHAA